MKNITPAVLLSFLALAFSLAGPGYGASEREKAVDQAKAIQAAVKPGEIATSPGGYSMTAKIGGKEWIATSMMPPLGAGRILGSKGEESISIPFSKSSAVTGRKIAFGPDFAVDLFTDDDIGIWGGRSGELVFTKVDGTAAEGTFHFTATARGTNKKIEVTDGTFRVLLSP